ncbi:MAG: hypothetical protein M3550_00950, partial [Actinomycetota bacterium]|nr:hypothetical protein [Actinomycetota bacterium]
MNRHGIAVGLLIATLLLVGYAAVGGVLNSEVSSGPDDAAWVGVAFGAVVLAFTTSGYIIASRNGNPLGWLLLGIGTIEALGAAASAYAVYALLNRPSSLPGEMAAWTADFIIGGLGIVFGSLIFVFLLFPDGRLPGRWWRTVAGVGFGGIVLAQVQVALNPGRLAGFPTVDNPLGVRGLEDAIAVMQSVAFGALTLSLLAAAVSLVIRFRRSRGIERQQLKWFTTASAFLALAIVSGPIWWGLFPGVGNVVWPVLFASSLSAIPIAMGIAILKYRLYDIDVVINKTLVFGALAAFITGIYVAVVVGIGELLGSAEEPNLALSIAATALVAIAFQPVKDRVERVANRLVYGVRRTPY